MKRYQIIGTTLAFQTILLTSIILIDNVTGAATGNKDDYQSLISGQGLYSTSDRISILNSTNFKSTIYGSKTSWLVEFYNSWCGFCHRFAPTWKALAQNIEREYLTGIFFLSFFSFQFKISLYNDNHSINFFKHVIILFSISKQV